jgi:hypothetical protein
MKVYVIMEFHRLRKMNGFFLGEKERLRYDVRSS